MDQTPGRGKKQCPACSMYLGVRSSKCQCGHDFTANIAAKVTPKAATKAEPEMMPEVSVTSASEVVAEAAEMPEAPAGSGLSRIFAPGVGMPTNKSSPPLCPVKPEGNEKMQVFQWIDACQNAVISQGYEYAQAAFMYMANLYWPRYLPNSEGTNPEYVKACGYIKEAFELAYAE